MKNCKNGGPITDTPMLSPKGVSTSPKRLPQFLDARAANTKKFITEDPGSFGAGSDKRVQALQKAKGGWIQGAIKHPGALHRSLHVPMGQKIPAAKLAKAAHSSNPQLARRAALAKELKGFHKASGGEVKTRW